MTYLFRCSFCCRPVEQEEAFFNEGTPFCSDLCRTNDFRNRNMVYIDLWAPQPDSQPGTVSPELGSSDGSSFNQIDDLSALPEEGNAPSQPS